MDTPQQQQGQQDRLGQIEVTLLEGHALRQVEDAISAVLPDDEVVVHLNVVVETRCGPDARRIKFRRFSPPGSDPILSLGLLTAVTGRLSRRLGLTGEL